MTNTSVEALISVSFFRLPYLTFLEVNFILFHGLSHHKELWWNIAYCSPTIGPYARWFILVSIIACILWIIALVYVTYAHACLNCGHPSRFKNLNLQYSAMFPINSWTYWNLYWYSFISYIWHLCWKMCGNLILFYSVLQ